MLVVAVGLAGMATAAVQLPERHVITGLALAHSGGYLVGAVVLIARERLASAVARPFAGATVAGAAAGLAAWLASELLPGEGRAGAFADVAVGTVALTVVYLTAQWVQGSAELREVRRFLRPSLP